MRSLKIPVQILTVQFIFLFLAALLWWFVPDPRLLFIVVFVQTAAGTLNIVLLTKKNQRTANRQKLRLEKKILEIEERKKNLQIILEGMTTPVVLLDESLEIQEINPAALDLVGMRGSQCRKKGLLSVFRSPELYDLSHSAITSAQDKESLISLNLESGEKHFQTVASLISTGCLLVMNDVTRIKHLETVRKNFVADVSHELRTPITSILGFVETLRQTKDIDNERRAYFLSIIFRQAERLEHIVGDLLTLSRLEENRSKIVPREFVSVTTLFKRAVDLLSFKAESRHVHFHLDIPKDLEVKVFPIPAEQALVNLLDNAVNYSPSDSEVFLSAAVQENEIVLSVKDQGPGLPESERERIFERFHRVDKARSREQGGTGLGLAIVKHTALKHGGRVWVESRLGEGCEFYIAFPGDSEG